MGTLPLWSLGVQPPWLALDSRSLLGPGMGLWQRWGFRWRHHRIRRLFGALIRVKGESSEEAEQAVEQGFELISGGKQGWSYVSAGEIEYLRNVLKGL